jgi:putative transcriptional regulator
MNVNPQSQQTQPLNGRLLLASPALQGGMFERSVVLLSEHSLADGAFGLVLNRPTGKVVGDVLPKAAFRPLRHVEVHQGGPVEEKNLFFSAFWWDETNGLQASNQISAEEAMKMQQRPGMLLRAFVGYSGWSPGQLEEEMQSQSWMVAKPSRNLLGWSHDVTMWSSVLRELSPFHKLLAEMPRNPMTN